MSFKSLVERLKKTSPRRRLAAGIIAVLCLAALLVFPFLLGASYTLHPTVKHGIHVIPDDAVYYLEIRNPQEFANRFKNSALGAAIRGSSAWRKLAGTPEFKKLLNVLYFIELKAGIAVEPAELPSFFGGSAGIAKMADGSMLIAARTNLKSKLGVGLYSAFKGERVELRKEPAKKEERKNDAGPGGENVVSPEDYEELYAEERIALENLPASRISVMDGFIYLLMLDDFLFVSDSPETLKRSLAAATKPGGNSLKAMPGMDQALSAMDARGEALLYAHAEKSIAAPLLRNTVNGRGIALVLYLPDGAAARGDIYTIDPDGSRQGGSGRKGPEWQKSIPSDCALAFYSRDLGPRRALERISSLDEEWKNLKNYSREFFSAAGIDPAKYFGEQAGIALVLHGMELAEKKLYPQFSIGYGAAVRDDSLMKAIFAPGTPQPSSFQGKSYTSLAVNNGRHYTPACAHDAGSSMLCSGRALMEKYIAASNRNRPALGDLKSFQVLGEDAKAPHHLVINVDGCIEALRDFYYYGAGRASSYTSATIDRDILPLAEPFRAYSTVHIVLGLAKEPAGRLVIVEKQAGR